MKCLIIILIIILLTSCASSPCKIGTYGIEPETKESKK